jgi:hypothetical protein
MTVRWTLKLWSDDPRYQGTVAVPADVKTTASWESRDSFHLIVVNGRWDGSDLVGRGGSLYFSKDQTERFRLQDFKPFEQNYDQPGYRCGDKGSGKWLNPWFAVGSTDLTWEIASVVRGGQLYTIRTTDDADDYVTGDDGDSGQTDTAVV